MFGDGSTAEQRAARRKRDRSILDSLTGSLPRLRDRRQRGGSRRARRLRRECPRDRAPAADRDEGLDGGARPNMAVPVGVPQIVRRTHQAAVRPAGAGVPGRHHARRHAALRARPHRPHLSGKRAPTVGLPRRVAPRRGSAADRRSCRRSTSTTSRCWPTWWRRLAKTQDGDGTLLDQSLVLYGSNMGNSNQHVHYDVPHVLVGGAERQAARADATWRTRPRQVPTGNLLLSVLDMFDIHQDSIGDSTGRLDESRVEAGR